MDSHVSREGIQGKGEQVNKGGRQEEEELWQRKRTNRKRHFYSFSNQSDAPISGIKTKYIVRNKNRRWALYKRPQPKRTQQREHVNEAGFSVQHRPDSLLSVGAPGVLNVKSVRECVWTVSSTCLHSRKKRSNNGHSYQCQPVARAQSFL